MVRGSILAAVAAGIALFFAIGVQRRAPDAPRAPPPAAAKDTAAR